MPRGRKIQGWSPPFDKWVIEQLVERGFEISENSFVSRIVRGWIEGNRELLEIRGISEAEYRQETKPDRKAAVVQMRQVGVD